MWECNRDRWLFSIRPEVSSFGPILFFWAGGSSEAQRRPYLMPLLLFLTTEVYANLALVCLP